MKKWQGCRGCSEYSYHLSRCKLGRINPRTLKQALSASAIMGTEYICNHNGMNWKVTEARKNENNPDNN